MKVIRVTDVAKINKACEGMMEDMYRASTIIIKKTHRKEKNVSEKNDVVKILSVIYTFGISQQNKNIVINNTNTH